MEIWFFYKKSVWSERFDIKGFVNNVVKKLALTIKVKFQHFVLMNAVINGNGILLDKGKNLMNIPAHTAEKRS